MVAGSMIFFKWQDFSIQAFSKGPEEQKGTERTERIFRNTLFDQPALSEKNTKAKNRKLSISHNLSLAFQSKHQGE